MPSSATIEKYQKKRVVIDAVQLTQDNAGAVADWSGSVLVDVGEEGGGDIVWSLHITTLEGVMTANTGDWIIKGIEGEFYPCKDSVFQKSYDLLSDADERC